MEDSSILEKVLEEIKGTYVQWVKHEIEDEDLCYLVGVALDGLGD